MCEHGALIPTIGKGGGKTDSDVGITAVIKLAVRSLMCHVSFGHKSAVEFARSCFYPQ